MNLDRILELLARQLGNAATQQEILELEQLLEQHPNHQQLVSILRSIQSKKLKQPAQNEEMIVREGWEKLQQKLQDVNMPPTQSSVMVESQRRSMYSKVWMRSAAVLIGLVILSSTYYFAARKKTAVPPAIASVQEVVPHGKPEMKLLPDGSVVWLNAVSKIRYEAEQNTRDVYLEGEAYFKVKHDAEHPFIVHAGNIAVRALGTEFNVSAYPGDEHVATTLITGKVQVTMEERPDQKIILVPNEKFTVTNTRIAGKEPLLTKEISYELKPVDIPSSLKEAAEVAWMQDKLVFQNEPFHSLAKRLERRYDVHIVFYDESLKKESLSGIFENENIQKALRVLQMTTSFQYRIKADSVILSRSL